MLKNINWNGGARKRLKTLYNENGSFGVFFQSKNTLDILPLQKKLYQTAGLIIFCEKKPNFYLENEEELFLRLFYKEERQKLLKPQKSPEKLPEKPDQRNREKFLSILGKFGPEKTEKNPFVSENYRKKL